MENEPRSKSQHRKRRERAHQLVLDNSETDGEAGENGQTKGPAGRGRSKPRKKKGGVGKYEEDIIDGFAIISFTSVEDLEKFSSGKLSIKNNVTANKFKNNNSLSLGRHKSRPNVKKKERSKEKKPPGVVPNHKRRSHSAEDVESSGETTDQFDTADLLNGSFRHNSRRLSDVSTISSSGAGYMCSDSESIDDQVSDGSSDIFTTKPLNHTIKIKRDPVLPVYPPSLPCSTTITTACTVTSTTSDVTVATITTTTSCVSLVTAPKTTPATVTTASPTVNGPHRHSNHQPQISQYQPPVSHQPLVSHQTSLSKQNGNPSHQPSVSQPSIHNGNPRLYPQNPHHIQASPQPQHPQQSPQPTSQNHHHQAQQHNQHQPRQQSQPQHRHLNPQSHQSLNQQGNQHPHQQVSQHTNQPQNQHPNQHSNKHPTQHSSQYHHPNQPHSQHQKNQHHSQHPNQLHNQQSSAHQNQHPNQHPTPHPSSHQNQSHHQQHSQSHQQQSQHHNQQRPKHDRPTSNSPTVGIKRRPPTPTLTKSRSPPRQPKHHIAPSVPHQLASSASPVSSLSLSNTVISKEVRRSTPPARPRSPRRDDSRDRERETHQVLPASLSVSSKSFFPSHPSGHGSTTPAMYSPLGQSPVLPVHSTPGLTPTFPGAPVPTLHAHPPSTPQGHNMFAPPMPLAPPPQASPLTPTVTAAPAHLPAESALSLANPDVLRDELNRRFLASQDRSSLLQAVPPYLKADVHQHMHQHQHQHQHTHQHTYTGLPGAPGPPPGSIVSTPTPPHLYEKLPGSPFYRQPGVGLPHRPSGCLAEPNPRHQIPNGKDKPIPPQHPRSAVAAMSGYPSLLLNPAVPGGAGPLNSGIPGAFQPKNVSSLTPGSMLLPGMREREKTPTLSSTSLSSLPGVKKSGKWCAVHVRVAWEIYNHQQRPSDKGPDTKPVDPLRPFGHMLPGGGLPRPQDLTNSASSPLLGSNPVFDSSGHSLLNSVNHMQASPFPRPYSVGGIVGIGPGNGLPSTSRESPAAIPSGSQHELSRLHHRTPPTFPVPPGWPRSDDRDPREKEMERERERELERRREEDRERERRLREEHDRHRFASLDERGRERDHYRNAEMLAKSRSRSRSRSPMRNGRIDSIKLERSYDERRRMEEHNFLKIKEERREREDELLSERDRLLKNDYLTSSVLRAADPFLQANLLDRTRMLVPGNVFPGDRVPPPHAAWNPFDRGQMEYHNHRLLQREIEQHTRDQLLNRFPTPQVAMGMAVLEQERLKEDMLLREERARREYVERLPLFERERLYYENSKLPMLRPPDPLSVLNHTFSRTVSPHISKSSPAMLPCAPPPLIHSVSAAQSRIHPVGAGVVHKTKGVSPTDSVGESKRDSNSTSTDPDAHSR